jgi:hypothetical protein
MYVERWNPAWQHGEGASEIVSISGSVSTKKAKSTPITG